MAVGSVVTDTSMHVVSSLLSVVDDTRSIITSRISSSDFLLTSFLCHVKHFSCALKCAENKLVHGQGAAVTFGPPG